MDFGSSSRSKRDEFDGVHVRSPPKGLSIATILTALCCLMQPRPAFPPANTSCEYITSRVRCREGYDDWNENDVCLLLEKLAFGTVGHLFGTNVAKENNLANSMARSRRMKMVPFRW